MRKLAATLGVNPMSLYHHVPNKAALLRGVTKLVATQFPGPSADVGTWREQLRQFAHDYRSLAHRHSNLVLSSFTSPDFMQREDPLWLALCRILDAAGVPTRDIARVGAVLASLFSGFLLAEINGTLGQLCTLPTAGADRARDADEASGVLDATDRSFEVAVQLLLAGLEAQLADPSAVPGTDSVTARRIG